MSRNFQKLSHAILAREGQMPLQRIHSMCTKTHHLNCFQENIVSHKLFLTLVHLTCIGQDTWPTHNTYTWPIHWFVWHFRQYSHCWSPSYIYSKQIIIMTIPMHRRSISTLRKNNNGQDQCIISYISKKNEVFSRNCPDIFHNSVKLLTRHTHTCTQYLIRSRILAETN